MSQRYDYPPPPPTPGSHATADFSHQRRAMPAQPPSITTTFMRTHGVGASAQTPLSALPSSAQSSAFPYTPHTPAVLHARTPSALNPTSHPTLLSPSPPASAMEPYNPRQWSSRGQVSGSQMVFGRASNAPPSTRDATGMEAAMPSPPPPYSPESPDVAHQTTRASPMLDSSAGFTSSPLAAESSSRQSPHVLMSPAFPPPPPAQSSRYRERSASGLTGRSFFSNLRGKQPVNVELPQSNPVHIPQTEELRPPAARRAASTGHMHPQASGATPAYTVSGPADQPSPESSWQPGMPLPGPPPGPPPPGARSQSLNRYPAASSRSNSQASEHGVEGALQRRAVASSSLGPIPPTPADWVENDNAQPSQTSSRQQYDDSSQPDAHYQPLRINTGANRDSSLARRHARRDTSAQGIRERRSLSRQARGNDMISPIGDDARPSDLIFTPIEGSIRRRRDNMRSISGKIEPNSAPSSSTPAQATVQPPKSASKRPANVDTPPYTPAFSLPDGDVPRRSAALRVPNSASSDRPISHLLHAPNNEDSAMPAPLSPVRPPSAGSVKTSSRLDAFALQALERHRAFVEKEASASTDEERLELFANFLVHESRLRRDRYATAYNAMAGDIVDLTRDMWRSYMRNSKRAATPSTSMSSVDPTAPSWASDGLPASAHANGPSSASSLGDFTPGTDSGSTGDHGEGMERSESRQWGEVFKPSLSPIPSMAVSTVHDEGSSRGRQPSRWWEQSNSGSGSIGKPDRMERSHRETKYMGVNPATLQDTAQPSPDHLHRSTPTSGASGTNEYPPEKVGWHEGDFDTPMATPARQAERHASTPGIEPMNVSRLVTLPPPYPRHHPAVSNSHPLLGDLRGEHRALADHSDIQKIKDDYLDQDFALQRQQQEAAKERKAKLRATIQEKIADGTMSFAEAAKAEAEFDTEEPERGKTNARAAFDVFETSVSHPLNTLLTERLERATKCIRQLQAELESRNQASDPNLAQEEGDEQPERLEKLTLLKWLFEAREQLHKEMFDLHAQRSDKYSEVILTPYRISKLQAKIEEATKFFTKDSQTRQMTFAKDALKRFEELQHVMDKNVSRGVEDQLSAFWDIAPNLLEVIQNIPSKMAGFKIHIPAQEYEENASYADFPLQYLYSVLSHAEKSAYQFIESQTNLLCLLHEVRTAMAKSSLRLIEIERTTASPNDHKLEAEMVEARRLEEDRLTEDLKEKVGEVERQWREALGEKMEECKARVRGWLEESEGWEDGLGG